jgi:hypothetical protein
MLEDLRKPPFFAALAVITLVVLVELSSLGYLGARALGTAGYGELPTPGDGIPYLALLDGIVLFTIVLNALPLLVTDRIHGRVQGVLTLVFSLLVLLAAIALILVAILLLTLMVSLLVAVPFGTAIYLAKYGAFKVGAAAGTLAALMTLKLAFAVLLVIAHQRFLENRGLVLLVLTSLLANVVVAFLHGFPPRILVSITDEIAAIVVGIVAAIWALVFLIGSIKAVAKALNFGRAFA